MNNLYEDQIDALLTKRKFEPCREGGAEHIIALATQMPQQVAFSLMAWLQASFAELMLPRPAYVMATLLLLGTIIGSTALNSSSDEEEYIMGLQASLYEEAGNL